MKLGVSTPRNHRYKQSQASEEFCGTHLALFCIRRDAEANFPGAGLSMANEISFLGQAFLQLSLQKPSFRFRAAALKRITITVGSFIKAAEIHQELPADGE